MEQQTLWATHVVTTILLIMDRKEMGLKIADYLMMMTFLLMKCVVDVKVCEDSEIKFQNTFRAPLNCQINLAILIAFWCPA